MRDAFGQFGKVRLGLVDTSLSTFSNLALNPGTLVNSGVSFFGGTLQFGTARAAVNIGPPLTIPGLSLPFSLEVSGVSNFLGNTNQIGVYICSGVSIFNAASTVNAVKLINGSHITNGPRVINGTLVVNGNTHINGFLSFSGSIVGVTKKFDIPHPTKRNHRLAHISLEGPEAGVYYRGKIKNNNIIDLPDYWKGLVNVETITVHLTPENIYQELHYKIIDWGTKIKIVNNAGGPIDCSFIVYGERKDVDKLVVEYEGNLIKENG